LGSIRPSARLLLGKESDPWRSNRNAWILASFLHLSLSVVVCTLCYAIKQQPLALGNGAAIRSPFAPDWHCLWLRSVLFAARA
jgi:hypothetical protein